MRVHPSLRPLVIALKLLVANGRGAPHTSTINAPARACLVSIDGHP